MLSHLSLGVRDLEKAEAFHDSVLGALGYARVWSNADGIGYGPVGGNDKLALFPRTGPTSPPGAGFHLAFEAPSRTAVDAFYATALRLGAQEEGPPGSRPHYGATYYAGFVIDPDGHKIEAVHQ